MGASRKRTTHGFTIVELLIVLVVIAILAAIVIVAYNGVASKASDSSAKSNIETTVKKLEVAKVSDSKYPLRLADINGGGITAPSDTRIEYTSDGATYCVTTSSIRAKTNYFEKNNSGTLTTGTCPNHLGYAGGEGTFSTASIFGDSAPTGSYQVYNDGGGDLWIGDRFYTMLDRGIRIVGARVWEPATASAAFLSTPLSVQAFTQDWQGSDLGGWGSLGPPALTATYSGTRSAGSWTYVWFPSSATIKKSTATAGTKDNVTIAVRYDGDYYVAANPAMHAEYTESNQTSGVYLSEDGDVGRSVSNVYSGSGGYYYGVDLLFTPL
jgi:prepilin-type N-terminal cleavage/methylation domain-containing protein